MGNTERVITTFLFLPLTLKGVTKWLVWVDILQEYCFYCDEFNWRDIKFFNK